MLRNLQRDSHTPAGNMLVESAAGSNLAEGILDVNQGRVRTSGMELVRRERFPAVRCCHSYF